ncbi:CapA family protein [Halegenticoccus soli]|uniref:CapA family protein n=1 Tax=Halegenticoccus soli TaxID=1985678 RepID=UPI000C6CE7E2|nr:CapA family protein [Halegenticoccus soli]
MAVTTCDRVTLADGDEEWSVLLAGDCIYRDKRASRPISEPLVDRISRADLSVVNLEAPISGPGEPIDKSGPVKQSDPEVPELLVDAGFDAVTLANNHIMDHGAEGLEATLRACRTAGLSAVGAGESAEDALEPLTATVGSGRTLSIVNVCEREFGVADEDEPGTAWIGHHSVERRISTAADEADAVLVVAHGGVEYVPLPPQQRQAQLRALVDAGANAVVGHHPHVPQGWEVYDGSPICYSLGNFLFRQSSRPKTQWGLAVELGFDGGTPTGLELIPTEQVDGVVVPLGAERSRDEHLEYLHQVSEITADRSRLRAHWQELAVRLFAQRYTSWLRAATGAGLLQLVRNPRAALGGGTWDVADRQSELLTLLNLVRNESHRDVIETALAVKTGEQTDRRTPAVRRNVCELLSWTEDQAVYDRPSAVRRTLKAVFDQIR